jgi:hypothetical protein
MMHRAGDEHLKIEHQPGQGCIAQNAQTMQAVGITKNIVESMLQPKIEQTPAGGNWHRAKRYGEKPARIV